MMIAADHRSFRLRILRSGSSGNAIYVEAGPTRILIDAGLPAETLTRDLLTLGLSPSDLTAVLLTHEHEDHAKGAAALARVAGIPLLANEPTLAAAGLSGPLVERFETGRPFRVGEVTVDPFAVSHDAVEPVGFVLASNGARAVVVTDLGAVSDDLIARARFADALIIEANYDVRLLAVSPYPWFLKNRIVSGSGHLSNDAAARAVVAAGASGRPQTVVLVHLSDINNLTPLARDTVQWALDREGMGHVHVSAVRPNGPSDFIAVA